MGGQHSQPCAEYGQAACIVKLCAGVCVYVSVREGDGEIVSVGQWDGFKAT